MLLQLVWHAADLVVAIMPGQRILLVMRARSAAMSNLSLSNLPSYSSAQSAKQTASLPCTTKTHSQRIKNYMQRLGNRQESQHHETSLCSYVAHLCFVDLRLRGLRRKGLVNLVLAPL